MIVAGKQIRITGIVGIYIIAEPNRTAPNNGAKLVELLRFNEPEI